MSAKHTEQVMANQDAHGFMKSRRTKRGTFEANHSRHLALFLVYTSRRTGQPISQIRWDRFWEVKVGQVPVGWAPVDHVFVEQFLSFRRRRGCSARSYNRFLSTLRLFFKYLRRRRKINEDPTFHVESARVTRTVNHHKYLTREECERLLEVALNSDFRQRDFTLVYTMLVTGARPGEVVTLRPEDVDFERGFVHVTGKTGRGPCSLFADLKLLLSAYLGSRWYQNLKDQGAQTLFAADGLGSPLTTRKLNEVIQALCHKAGIGKSVTSYWLRHTFATQFYRNGAGIVYVSRALRHMRLDTTLNYVHDRASRLGRLLDNSPMADLWAEFQRRKFKVLVQEGLSGD